LRKRKSNARNYDASDVINALLNYGHSILESFVRKAITGMGIDNSIGFLHEINPSRTPLVYDIPELFG
jgi:CRISPR-associated protein Cas1